MSQLPYSPMGKRDPLAGEAEIAAMKEKLANKLRPKIGTSPKAGETPKAELRIPKLEHEMWLVERLGQHGIEVFTGDTNPQMRSERIRKAIKEAGIGLVIVGRKRDGQPENYEECFQRLYGVPL